MTFKPAQCPNCGGALQLPEDRLTVNCMYCAATIIVKEAIQAAAVASVPNLLKLARTAGQSSNHQEAYDYYTRVLELDADNVQAWAGKAEACGRLSGQNSFRLSEMVGYFENAIDSAAEDQKQIVKQDAANIIATLTVQYYQSAREVLSPAFWEPEPWNRYFTTLGRVFKVLEKASTMVPENSFVLRAVLQISRANCDKVAFVNRLTGQRNSREIPDDWNDSIKQMARLYSEKLCALEPDAPELEVETNPTVGQRIKRFFRS